MHIKRHITEDILGELSQTHSQVIVIYGARQIGKTTLVNDIIKQTDYKTLHITGDDVEDIEKFSTRDKNKWDC